VFPRGPNVVEGKDRGQGIGGKMTQTLYAFMNKRNKILKISD
jgi:hypothetical protein